MNLHDLMVFSQWPGAFFGLLGAIMVASQTARTRYWGFVWFIVSDVFLGLYGCATGGWALAGLQVAWIVCSLRGAWMNSAANLTSKP